MQKRLAWLLIAFFASESLASGAWAAPILAKARAAVTRSIEQRCSVLKGMRVEGGTVIAATLVGHPTDVDPSLILPTRSSSSLQKHGNAFCRVEAISIPAAGAEIKTEIWLPADDDWNGKFYGTGNGGGAGIILYAALAEGLARGYAVANTDVGTHSTPGRDTYRFAIGRPELAKNFAYRGIHVMTVVGKQVLTAFYKKGPTNSIFAACSGGGYEALGEANRYPEDYDGIIAGDPAINFANLGLAQGYRHVVSTRSPSGAISPAFLPILADEVLSQCDSVDGLVDGIIDDPRRCRINFRRLACSPDATGNCLSPDQVATLEAIYGGLRDPRNGALIYPGFPPGAELSGGAAVKISGKDGGSFINDNTPGPLVWVLGADWSADRWATFDFGADGDKVRAAFAPLENSNPDFGPFVARGGKLILYTGWGDPNLNPFDIVTFFEAMNDRAGGPAKTRAFARLFMVPGMHHCGNGPGPNSFGQPLATIGVNADDDMIMALDRWVMTGTAPERIVATKFKDDKLLGPVERKRPLCAFPKVARWKGVGSIDDASQFDCVDP
jgi:feruloyl esterase